VARCASLAARSASPAALPHLPRLVDLDRWDLSDLPAYQPSRVVSGTIRIGKAEYLRTGTVMEQWAAAFAKHHPQIRFEHSGHGLATELADLVQQRGYTLGESQEAMLVRRSCPLEIEMATGSYDVPGPSVELVSQVDQAERVTV
jgi:phosphate transport system substrate-binding protein